jgi:hypothetical protein
MIDIDHFTKLRDLYPEIVDILRQKIEVNKKAIVLVYSVIVKQ